MFFWGKSPAQKAQRIAELIASGLAPDRVAALTSFSRTHVRFIVDFDAAGLRPSELRTTLYEFLRGAITARSLRGRIPLHIADELLRALSQTGSK